MNENDKELMIAALAQHKQMDFKLLAQTLKPDLQPDEITRAMVENVDNDSAEPPSLSKKKDKGQAKAAIVKLERIDKEDQAFEDAIFSSNYDEL
ncbi:hypothetical protein SBOR_8173 [Sclerotinia borealis F-4128]|uniref:Uncharacterized protein n=1 Tax=Sclerotinia borealis (strain F-4128) TaxID=1432307 RepID=W9CA75_SCLBF|nr:hypothetical protein SBOR_8173 [Sclerotinia borealis F-4128]